MKRFFCTTCKKIKYVNILPNGVENPKHPDPTQRLGTCKWHADKERGLTHAESIGSKRVRHPRTFSKPATTVAPKTKKKKG